MAITSQKEEMGHLVQTKFFFFIIYFLKPIMLNKPWTNFCFIFGK